MTTPTPTPELHAAGVDLNGLMSVLSKHLYSTPAVAVRELVQNAHDSMVRRRLEQPTWMASGRIHVEGNSQQGILRITDSGAGLTETEIHQYLATVGVGYTRKLREQNHDIGLIGLFGLGFLSSFVLADVVTVTTTSYQTPEQGWCYQSRNAQQYSVTAVEPRLIGTEVSLKLKHDFLFLASQGVLVELLTHYCVLLPEPIFIGQLETAINPSPPPWRNPTPYKEKLAFAARFEQQFEPITVMDVLPNTVHGSDAKGLLWIQDGGTYGTSDNRNLSVFVRGMLLDDDARDLLPHWAGFVGGVIESHQLTPTASREDLQRDAFYTGIQQTLVETLINGLGHIAKEQPEAWRRVLTRHNEALLAAALCDTRLFSLVAKTIKIPTSQGDLMVKDLSHMGKFHVTLGGQGGFEDMLFRALKIPVARGDRFAVVPFLRQWVLHYGGQLIELGTDKGNRALFQLDTLATDTMLWLSKSLCHGENERLIPAQFEPAALPLILVPDREAELKKRLEADEADKRMSTAALKLVRQFTSKITADGDAKLYLNLKNPAVQAILAAHRDHIPTESALRLLKSIKTIMTSGGEMNAHWDLNQALCDMNEAIVIQIKSSIT